MSRLHTKRNNKKEYLIYCCKFYEGYHYGTGISPDGGEPYKKFKTRMGTINYTDSMKMNFFDTKEEALVYMYEMDHRMSEKSNALDKLDFDDAMNTIFYKKLDNDLYCSRYPYTIEYVKKLMYNKYPHLLI
jgi:hypothetical protein